MIFETVVSTDRNRYARAVTASKKVRWDIDADVIRGRSFDLDHKFLPDGLSFARELSFLTDAERRFMSQVQGRTYAGGIFWSYTALGSDRWMLRAKTLGYWRFFDCARDSPLRSE